MLLFGPGAPGELPTYELLLAFRTF